MCSDSMLTKILVLRFKISSTFLRVFFVEMIMLVGKMPTTRAVFGCGYHQTCSILQNFYRIPKDTYRQIKEVGGVYW